MTKKLTGAMTGNMPDITLAQVLAGLSWISTQAVAAGLVDNEREKRYLFIGSTIVSATWMIGDVILRAARNIRHGMEAKAAVVNVVEVAPVAKPVARKATTRRR